jgi:hypothetical protein
VVMLLLWVGRSFVTVVGRTEVMLVSWVGQKLCYCLSGCVTVVGRAEVMLLSWVGQRLCYCRG